MSVFRSNLLPSLRRARVGQFNRSGVAARRCKSWKVIIEEPKKYKNPTLQKYHEEFMEYLGDKRMPVKLRAQLISSKLRELLLLASPSDPEQIDVIEQVLGNWQILNKNGEQFPLELLAEIFETHYDRFLSSTSKNLDDLVSHLARNFNRLPNRTLILLIDLMSHRHVNMNDIFASLTHRIDESFFEEYFATLKSKGKLNLGVFETLKNHRIGDAFVVNMNRYIESTFAEEMPDVHCFENLEKHLDRIQLLVADVIKAADLSQLRLESILTLLKLEDELAQVNYYSGTQHSSETLMSHLAARDKEIMEKMEKNSILKDEPKLALVLTKSFELNRPLFDKLADAIEKSESDFSSDILLQTRLLRMGSGENGSGSLLSVGAVEEFLGPHDVTEDTFEKLLSISAKYLPDDYSHSLIEYSKQQGLHLTSSVYKHLIDAAIDRRDHKDALQIIERSKIEINWTEAACGDPAVAKTFNDVIQCIMSASPLREAFPTFRQLKALMSTQVNIDTINLLVTKMLEEDLIGDVLETLKRELPTFKDEKVRLVIDQPFGYKYLELFNIMHNYVISNTSDPSVNRNWHLFVAMYKYFHIPSDKILPALKFFCDNKRWHGALLIFKKMVDLYQLHGKHSFQPPSKEIYTYLLTEFGDKLYEEGVIEIHDWLKMDMNIPQQGRELNNVIMNAYCNLQDVGKVRDLFLSASVNGGVDETSAVTMLKAYTYNDLHYVEKFWNNLSTFGLMPDYSLYRQYLIAYAYHGKTEKAFDLLEEIGDYDLAVNEDLLISMHNFCYIHDKQAEIRKWAKRRYPELWSKVETSGMLLATDGYKPHESFLVDGSTEEKMKLKGKSQRDEIEV